MQIGLKIIATLVTLGWCDTIFLFCDWVTELMFGNPKDKKELGKQLLLALMTDFLATLFILLCIV